MGSDALDLGGGGEGLGSNAVQLLQLFGRHRWEVVQRVLDVAGNPRIRRAYGTIIPDPANAAAIDFRPAGIYILRKL